MNSSAHTQNEVKQAFSPNSNSLVRNKLNAEIKKNPTVTHEIKSQAYKQMGPTLPVIEALKKVIPKPEEGGPSFAKVHFLSAQHLLETTLCIFDFALERGLRPEETVVIGKDYSTHSNVHDKLIAAGITVVNSPKLRNLYGFDTSYGEGCRKACIASSARADTSQFLPIIHDDGGGLAKILGNGSFDDSILKNATIVEQTSSGGPIMEDCASSHPRINLFGSCVKSIAEPPLVNYITTKNILKLCEETWGDTANNFKKPAVTENGPIFGIVGAGRIGYAIAKGLVAAKMGNIIVYDKDHNKMQAVVNLGEELTHSVKSEEDEKKDNTKGSKTTVGTADSAKTLALQADVVIGATGDEKAFAALADKYFTVTKPTILVSASSRQVEFLELLKYANRIELEKARKENREYKSNVDIGKTLYITNGWKTGILAIPRMGTPVTFNNTANAVPAELAQLIRGLIIVGLLQNIEISQAKQEAEKNGKKFENIGFQLSPLLQLFVAKTFLDTLTPEEQLEHYTKEEIETMTSIEKIAKFQQLNGVLYKPFEFKARKWLDGWLRENKLTQEVDKWLNPQATNTLSSPVKRRTLMN